MESSVASAGQGPGDIWRWKYSYSSTNTTAEQAVESEMKAMFMLAGANKARHDDLRTQFQNSFTVGRNEYQTSKTELLSMMNNWMPKRASEHKTQQRQCVHCRGSHRLKACPDITDKQLA